MSNVRLQFGDNIRLVGPRAWADNVRGQLLAMMMFRTGHTVISEVWAARPHHVTIRPYPLADINADSRGESHQDETPAGEPLRDLSGRIIGSHRGSGRGTSVTVRYTPGLFSADTALRFPPFGHRVPRVAPNGGVEQTVVLLHELSHALRSLYGASEGLGIPDTVPGRGAGDMLHMLPRHFENTEELFAITVANVFCSERSLSLRADHDLSAGPNGERINQDLQAQEFWRQPTIFRHLQSAMARMPRFAQRMETIDTAFNPFRSIRRGVRPYLRMVNEEGRMVDPYSAP